jgi:putative zinc finger protein
MRHLDEGTIHAWLDGALDAEEVARVEQHAAECATCAAAVAEARGFVAGASRILTALDHTPANVAPRATAFTSASPRGSRPRSVWTTFRLTPARVAAAAVVVVAVGTTLVLTSKPNGGQLDMDKMLTVSAPTAGVQVSPAPRVRMPVPAAADSAVALSAPASERMRRAGIAGRARGKPSGAPTAPSAKRSEARQLSDAVTTAAVRTAVGDTTKAASAQPPAAGAPRGEAFSAAAPRAAALPLAALRKTAANLSEQRATSYIGCYQVDADSIAVLPTRIALDTLTAHATLQRAPTADAAVSERYQLMALQSEGRRLALENAYWERLGAGAVRLSFGAPARSVDLRRGGESTLTGFMSVGDRAVRVTLHPLSCGGTKPDIR